MKNSIVLACLLFAVASGQPWLNKASPGMYEPPPMEMPFDSSQTIADRIVNSPIPVLIDFWAVWCGPCRMLNPIMEEMKKKFAGKVSFEKINVDVHRSISAYFRVSAIPAVFIVSNKTVVNYLQGLQPREAYEKALQNVLHPATGKPTGDTLSKQTQKNAVQKPPDNPPSTTE